MENSEDEYKTVEEIAREAMKAIKKSEQIQEMKEEEEFRLSQNKLKQEVEDRLRFKMRKLHREQEKEEKNKIPEVDTRFLVSWKSIDKNGTSYIGEYNDETVFKINRGISLFHLYITSKNVLHEEWQRNAHTSTSLDLLKEKADKILKTSNKKISNSKD
jgi:hypothetical protein